MRYASSNTRSWQHAISKNECSVLATQIVGLAAQLGFELARESVQVVRFLNRPDAIVIELEGSDLRNEGRHYIESPMLARDHETDPVFLNPMHANDLLEFLHKQRWRQERKRAIEALPHTLLERHLDGDLVTRWARSMALQGDGRIRKLNMLPAAFREIWNTCQCELRTDSGIVKMEGNTITLPFQLPEVFTSNRLLDLGEIIAFPPCGDLDIDEEIKQLMIREIETVPGKTTAPAHTKITIGYQKQASLVLGEDSVWRRLRAIRPQMMLKAPDYTEYDIATGAEAYHAQCNEALGFTVSLPISLIMKHDDDNDDDSQ